MSKIIRFEQSKSENIAATGLHFTSVSEIFLGPEGAKETAIMPSPNWASERIDREYKACDVSFRAISEQSAKDLTMLLISLAHADFVASERGYLLREDVLCWTSWYQEHPFFKNARIEVDDDNQDSLTLKLDKLFRMFPEFRSLFDYRVSGNAALLNHKTDTHRRATELHINCPQIGPRFRIQHGQNTYVFAREIGADFWVNHNVTIGANGGIPVIGDRVTIRTGAVVVGPITISDDVIVTANAVVACDVPRAHVAYAPKTIFLPRRGYDRP